jgi:hypothetical protein
MGFVRRLKTANSGDVDRETSIGKPKARLAHEQQLRGIELAREIEKGHQISERQFLIPVLEKTELFQHWYSSQVWRQVARAGLGSMTFL